MKTAFLGGSEYLDAIPFQKMKTCQEWMLLVRPLLKITVTQIEERLENNCAAFKDRFNTYLNVAMVGVVRKSTSQKIGVQKKCQEVPKTGIKMWKKGASSKN